MGFFGVWEGYKQSPSGNKQNNLFHSHNVRVTKLVLVTWSTVDYTKTTVRLLNPKTNNCVLKATSVYSGPLTSVFSRWSHHSK